MKLFSPEQSLRQRVLRAGFWAFALKIVGRLFTLGRTIVLARLLSPNDFGLFGLAILAMSALEAFSHTGFEPALIQKRGDIKSYLDITWTVQAIRGLFLALILYGIAPHVATFFSKPSAVPLLQVLGLSLIFQGLTNIGIVYFQKELEFHKQFVYSFSGTLVDIVVAISAALLLRDAWALLFGLLAGNFVRMVVSYLVHPYRPRLRFERGKFMELFRYGIWVSFMGIMLFVGTRGGGVVVGKVIGVTSLGLYQMAYRISQMAIRELTSPIESVAFPTYAQLQGNSVRMRNGYMKIAGFSVSLSMPIAVLIAALGSDFTRIFLGEKWMPMVPALALIAIAALFKSIARTGNPAFMGSGAPQIAFYIQGVKAATLLIFIYPLSILWGISGAALTVALTGVSTLVVWYLKIKRHLELTLKDIGSVFGPPLISSLTMAGAIYFFRPLTIPLITGTLLMDIVWFAAMILISAIVYLFAMYLCQLVFPEYQFFRGIWGHLQKN